MADKWMYIHYDDTQNYSFCRLQLEVETLDTQLNETTNQNSIKVPKVGKLTNKRTLLYNFRYLPNPYKNVCKRMRL